MSRISFEEIIAEELIEVCEAALDSRPPRDTFDEYRAKLAEKLSDRNYSTSAFTGVIDMILTIDEAQKRGFPSFEHDRDIPKGVAEVFDVYVASLVAGSTSILDAFDDQDYNLVLDLMDTPLGQEIAAGSRRGGRSRGGRSEPARRGFSGYSDRDRDERDNRGGHYGRDRDDRSGRGPSRIRSRETETSVARTRSNVTRPNVGVAAIASQRIQASDEAEAKRAMAENTRRLAEERNSEEVVDIGSLPITKIPAVQGIDYTKSNPHADFWKDDKHYQAAHISNWALTGATPRSNLVPLYDIRTHILYYVKDVDGNVGTELIRVNDENRYVNHTLFNDPKRGSEYRRKALRLTLKADKETQEDTVENTIEQAPTATGASDIVSTNSLDYQSDSLLGVSNPTIVDGLDAQIFDAMTKVEKYGTDTSLVSAFSTYISRHPVILPDAEQAEIIHSWYECPTLSTLATEMTNSRELIEPGIFDTIGDRISAAIVDNLNNACNVSLVSMAFPKDWNALVDYLRSTYKEEGASEILLRINSVIPEALAYLSADNLSVFDDLGDMSQSPIADRIVMFIEHVGIVATKFTMDNLGIGNVLDSGKPVVTTGKDATVFLHFVRTIETACDLPLHRILIATACGRKIRVRRWGNTDDSIILHRIK